MLDMIPGSFEATAKKIIRYNIGADWERETKVKITELLKCAR